MVNYILNLLDIHILTAKILPTLLAREKGKEEKRGEKENTAL